MVIKFNVVYFLCNCITYIKFNTNVLHNILTNVLEQVGVTF